MKLKRVIPFAHELMKLSLEEGDIAIDGTCGNGHDTALLGKLVGSSGHVYGYDVQKQAIDNTNNKLEKLNLKDRVSLIHDSHHKIEETIPKEHLEKLKAAIFNLGYLPGSDKKVVTSSDETISAVSAILEHLLPGGIVVLVVYHGHPGGAEEKEAVLQYAESLEQKNYQVMQYGFINQKNNPPFIIAIEKL
ncbi:class I SAM-dependent methyltransferase [Halobacillus sp. Marseille-Q1614]|uniref:tRNA (mnm(5)s(2)U34)-methyltransferase n=1 Tax=Halobacillus sp. Marseille-Q1614 TaxID=2709134 RepID=UPI00156FCD65|nr:class I SAM-dependent methyltransferase [Halobacillus sp. Marseille-Q1614]